MKATRRARAEDRRLYTPTAPTGRTVAPHKDTEVPGGFEHTIFGPQASVFVRCHAAPYIQKMCICNDTFKVNFQFHKENSKVCLFLSRLNGSRASIIYYNYTKYYSIYYNIKLAMCIYLFISLSRKPTPPTVLNVENSKLACRMVVRFRRW